MNDSYEPVCFIESKKIQCNQRSLTDKQMTLMSQLFLVNAKQTAQSVQSDSQTSDSYEPVILVKQKNIQCDQCSLIPKWMTLTRGFFEMNQKIYIATTIPWPRN